MKRVLTAIIVSMLLSVCAFGETIHIRKGYALEKDKNGIINKVQVLKDDGNYSTWYIHNSIEHPDIFYGENDDVIIFDELIDIAVITD